MFPYNGPEGEQAEVEMKACCFTGHRDLPAGQEGMIIEKACEVLDRLMEEGVTEFGSAAPSGLT